MGAHRGRFPVSSDRNLQGEPPPDQARLRVVEGSWSGVQSVRNGLRWAAGSRRACGDRSAAPDRRRRLPPGAALAHERHVPKARSGRASEDAATMEGGLSGDGRAGRGFRGSGGVSAPSRRESAIKDPPPYVGGRMARVRSRSPHASIARRGSFALVALIVPSPVPQPGLLRPAVLPRRTASNFQYEDAGRPSARPRASIGLRQRPTGEKPWPTTRPSGSGPGCGMARQIPLRLGPTAERAPRAAKTDREALSASRRDPVRKRDRAARDQRTRWEMRRLAKAYPDDLTCGPLRPRPHGTMARSPRSSARRRSAPSALVSEVQKEVRHPAERPETRSSGSPHYLIHDYDDPDHPAGPSAARAYAKVPPIEPRAAHARPHFQLGTWDAAASRRSVLRAPMRGRACCSGRHARLSQPLPAALRVAQQGRFQKARRRSTIRPRWTRPARVQGGPSDMRARYVVETRDFQELGRKDFARVELFRDGKAQGGA